MPSAENMPVLVWIGRFAELSGYGSAARTYLEVCRNAGLNVVAIDSESASVVGPSSGVPLALERGHDGRLIVRGADQDTRLLAVLHETPPHRERVNASGRVRLVGYTVFETDSLPQEWLDPALDFDELWTASSFNQRTFAQAGVPAHMIRCVPHAIDPALQRETVEPMELPDARGFVFLSVLSAFNRKDAGGLLRAYRKAFTSDDNVTLVLKLRANATDADIEQHVWGPARPEFERSDPDAPHVVLMREDLSDERLWALMRRADVCVSLERGKGWDLPSMEAMALGTPVVALGWGGIEAFVNDTNAMVVPPAEQLVAADPTLVQGHTMYAGHRWATYSPSEAARAMRTVFEDDSRRAQLAKSGRESVHRTCEGSVVAGIIAKRLGELRTSDLRGDTRAVLEVVPPGSSARQPPQAVGVAGAGTASVRPINPPEATRLMAHLREVAKAPWWKPRQKLERLEAMMAAYHSAKESMRPEHPVAHAFEQFASVPREHGLDKLKALSVLARQEVELLYAASDMSEADAFEAYRPGESLDDWVARRKALWIRTGGLAPESDERARLATLRNRGASKKIVIVGNAPSLRRINLDALTGVPTFAANRIYLAYDQTDWRPTYYTCLDWRVTPDNYAEINQLTGSTFFFPNRFRGLLRTGDDVYWYHSINRTDRWREQFETNATHGVRGLGTVVTAMLQLAWHMGYREFILIGVDADYAIPKTVEQAGPAAFDTGQRLELTSTRDDDSNHFDPRYFGTGKRWHDPNVDEMVRCFAICRKAIEARGGRLVNATPGGKLEVLDRVKLDEELGVRALRPEQPGAQLVEPAVAFRKPLDPHHPDRLLR